MIPMVSITPKQSLALGQISGFLLEPVSAQELSDARVIGFLLWGLEWDKPVKVLIDDSRLTGAAV